MICVNKHNQISINYPDGSSHYLAREDYFDGFEEFINFNEHRFVRRCECSCIGKNDLELYLGNCDYDFFMSWVHFCNTMELTYLKPYLDVAHKI